MKPATILVVEDNPTTRKLFRITLEAEGYRVLEAADGATAIRLMAEDTPELVLQDLLLPDIQGPELTRRLRAVPGRIDVPILALSGFRSALSQAGGPGLEVDASLLKPIEPSRLVEAVRSFLPARSDAEDNVGRGRRILVVDDDPVQLKLSRLRLGAAGFNVVPASDSAGALEQARQHPPDAILSDVLMPNLDGFELCLAVRRDPRLAHVPVVLTSAHYHEERDEALARKVGADALVVKGPDDQAILEALVGALRKSSPTPASEPVEALRSEHGARVAQQLKRQASVNASLAERCALQAAQLSILGGVADALARTADLETTLGDVMAACLDAGGISKGARFRVDSHGKTVVAQSVGFSDAERPPLETLLHAPAILDAMMAGRSLSSTGIAAAASSDLAACLGTRIGLLVPLLGEDGFHGALLLGSSAAGSGEEDLLAFGRAIAAYMGQASSLVAAFERLRTTSEASRVLAASLDLDATLAALAELLTTHLADLCEIDVLDGDGHPRRTLVIHADPTTEADVQQLHSDYPDASVTDPAGVVLRNGLPLIAPHSDDALAAAGGDAAYAERLRALGLQSSLVVPLRFGDRITGRIGFGRFRPGRRFTAADLTMAEDLARRTAIAVENARLYKDAQEASRAKDEFLATVSHELRTPLTAILGWSSMLRAKPANAGQLGRGLAAIERNSIAQAKLIEDILDVSRITAGKLPLNPRSVDAGALVRASVEVIFPAASAKGIALHVQCDPASGTVWGDPERLQQVLWNLLSNAVKFSQKGGRIDVYAARRGSSFEIRVADSGTGIRSDFLPFVFERFRQADTSTTRKYGGLGLGLALVRHLVELHGGTVRAASDGVGRGATFTIVLPIPAVLTATQPPERLSAPLPAVPLDPSLFELAGVRVLIVDDEPDARELLALVLETHGVEVIAAASAAEAMDALERFQPRVIVSDLGMPDEDGFSFIARVRAVSQVPAVALTAYAGDENASRTFRAGFQMHLSKPVTPARLLDAVARLAGPVAVH